MKLHRGSIVAAAAFGCLGCGAAPPPTPVTEAAPTEQKLVWLQDFLVHPSAMHVPRDRPLRSCEKSLVAQGPAQAFDLDVHPSAGREVVVVGSQVLFVLDSDCNRLLHRVATGTLRGSHMIGPTFDDVPWTKLSKTQQRRYFATDRVGAGIEFQLSVFSLTPRTKPPSRLILVLTIGAAGEGRFGYDALWIRCSARGCATMRMGHREWTTAGSVSCAGQRAAMDQNGMPAVRVRTDHDTIEVHQYYFARVDDCSLEPRRATWLRGMRWEGTTPTPLPRPPGATEP